MQYLYIFEDTECQSDTEPTTLDIECIKDGILDVYYYCEETKKFMNYDTKVQVDDAAIESDTVTGEEFHCC